MSTPQPKPWIAQIHAYVPGKSKSASGKPLTKLSANENPLGSSPAALAALAEGHVAADYPDPDARALREKIAEVHGLDPDRIVCGTGSGELLHCAVQALAGPGDEVLASRYSFSLYPLLAQKVGATPVLAADDNYAASVDNLLAAVTERTKVVLLDNPNNPVGTFLPPSEVVRLHAGLPSDVLLVVDEAYGEYVDPAFQSAAFELAAAHENVLVSRTFSKAYGLASERVGWVTGAPNLIDLVNRLRGAFNVSVSGQKAALAALGDQAFVTASREHNAKERTRFAEAIAMLGNHGISACPSEANFLLVHFEGSVSAAQALEALSDAGYAVRHLPSQGLPNSLRITIGTAEATTDVIATLRRLCGEAA
ncbi:histidinol-phosphate transaminase [Porphyrobacter sp. LM 6]|jgi:histidinol-phosphate aminotransferase|uniref:histidinol-phosphate transaminase n=1 Tax=Porphyrobacter sp. LM 6 TaxID=1896196 RepID=UPI00084782AE|nr:histidinol-phosphate transaminase [Porphyrobacter sp. LM 6]AOL93662.1 histidinol-phosphate aminotransferase [Porphyrobacter sp. LM 6]